MKYFTLPFIFIFLLPIFSYTQSNYSHLDKWRAVTLAFGARGFASDPGTIETNFVDDSPSMDSFSSIEEIDDFQNRWGGLLSFTFGRMHGISHKVIIDYVWGNSESAHFGYGIAYTHPIEVGSGTMLIRAGVTGMIGNQRISLGRIQNNAAFIQINQTQFFERELRVKLNADTYILRPQAEVFFPVSDNIRIFANLGYDIGGQTSEVPTLWFEPVNTLAENSADSAEKDLGPTATVTYNDENITQLPYDVKGLRFSIGAAFYWEK